MSRYILIIVFIFLSAADMRADIRSDIYYAYIKHLLIESRWGEAYCVKEFGKAGYPVKSVDYDIAIQRAVDTYKKGIKIKSTKS